MDSALPYDFEAGQLETEGKSSRDLEDNEDSDVPSFLSKAATPSIEEAQGRKNLVANQIKLPGDNEGFSPNPIITYHDYSNFNTVVQKGAFFIDKTLFIKEIIDSDDRVMLIIRPRRFGKSLNLTMLQSFFSNRSMLDEKIGSFFESKKIWQKALIPKYNINEFGKSPVIFLNFKDLRITSFSKCSEFLRSIVNDLYDDLIKRESEVIKHIFKPQWKIDEKLKVLKELESSDYYIANSKKRLLGEPEIDRSFYVLAKRLFEIYEKEVIVLIDEYDSLLNVYNDGERRECAERLRSFLSPVITNERIVRFTVAVGTLGLEKDSVFFGINFRFCGLTSVRFFTMSFGFLAEEIQAHLSNEEMKEVEEWFGNYEVYQKPPGKAELICKKLLNPWSVMKFFDERSQSSVPLKSHWIDSLTHGRLETLLKDTTNNREMVSIVEMRGASVNREIVEPAAGRGVYQNSQRGFFSFLFFNGYLTGKIMGNKNGIMTCELKIPNKELQGFFEDKVKLN